jgi:hypothetical protein
MVSHAATQGGEKVNLTVLPYLFQNAELAGLTIDDDGETRRYHILFLVVELRSEAWEGVLQVVDHLADGIAADPYALLPSGEAL